MPFGTSFITGIQSGPADPSLESQDTGLPQQLAQALQNQQNQPPPQQPAPQPQQPDAVSTGLDQAAQHYSQQLQQNQQPVASGGPVRRLLQNFIGGMGNHMMAAGGLATPEQKQQQAIQGLAGVAAAKAHLATIQSLQAQSAPVPVIGEDDKPITGPDGSPITVPANHAAQIYAARLAGQYKQTVAQTNLDGPILSPEQAQAMGHPEMAGQGLNKALGGIIQNQVGKMPVTADMISRYGMPPEMEGKLVKMSDILGAERLQAMGTKTTTGGTWKETSPGQWTFLPTTSTTVRGKPGMGGTAQGAAPGAPSAPGGANVPRTPGQLRTFAGGGPIYAFNPKTNETVLTTPAEAQQQGFTNSRKASATEIMNDTQLNNRLTDVATKVTRYQDAMNAPISQADRDMISGVLSNDKFKMGIGIEGAGFEVPVDRLNQALDAANVKNMSPAAKNALLAYLNARESMMGYTRVLTGSARSSDTSLGLNLQALPSPVMPNDYIKNGIDQFKQNISLAGRGLPRMPGIPQAKDVMGESGEQKAPSVRIKLSDGRTGTIPASSLKKYQQMGATVVQ